LGGTWTASSKTAFDFSAKAAPSTDSGASFVLEVQAQISANRSAGVHERRHLSATELRCAIAASKAFIL
jgi:hypothetical protein